MACWDGLTSVEGQGFGVVVLGATNRPDDLVRAGEVCGEVGGVGAAFPHLPLLLQQTVVPPV